MPNPNPSKARQARKRRAKPGTVKQLQAVLWRAITHLEAHLDAATERERPDTGEVVRLTHALSQAAGPYLKALEVAELEVRVSELERAQRATELPTSERAA